MDHLAFTYSALAIFGGSMGYFRKRSKPSLIAGVTIGGIFAGAGYLLHNNMEYGIHTALLGSSLMLVGGAIRGSSAGFRKPIPLTLVILGGLSTLYYAKKYTEFY
ncbi:hypothetical protein PACTADRAFT_31982 [Pachysolen tannophilus NRRL Y-2460]|uniref:Transmembrane protein 14C n=1 Tax=Pachysolen tannophilus NRRL Y-2460 TaxID=669874 RepID=A0A1E4U3M8_PACTA|nr:hypothetical protein PACTADRAFT_31982 [Pachysolen tannophilus NRRL Y-2460]